MFNITKAASEILDSSYVVRETDRTGYPHLLVKVPDIQKIPEADIGLEVNKDEEGAMLLTLLLYDQPTEPISYEIKFLPTQAEDLKFLKCFIDAAQFRLHPCIKENSRWVVGNAETFRIPANVLLRLKHFSLEWPLPTESFKPEKKGEARETIDKSDCMADASGVLKADGSMRAGVPDPRDTVIRKLKEQNHILRDQLRIKDKRIIELEDELNEIKSKGRAYRLGEKKSWWKPF